jgi:hypothetical protein
VICAPNAGCSTPPAKGPGEALRHSHLEMPLGGAFRRDEDRVSSLAADPGGCDQRIAGPAAAWPARMAIRLSDGTDTRSAPTEWHHSRTAPSAGGTGRGWCRPRMVPTALLAHAAGIPSRMRGHTTVCAARRKHTKRAHHPAFRPIIENKLRRIYLLFVKSCQGLPPARSMGLRGGYRGRSAFRFPHRDE